MRERLLLALLSGSILLAGCGDDGRGRPRDAGPAGDGAAAIPCDDDSDCDDGHACTVDSCGVGNLCSFNPVDALCDGDLICAIGRGCIEEPECSTNEECDDSIECTIDSCAAGGVCRNMALHELCDEPGSMCDPAMGGCTEGMGCSSAAECDDSIACTDDSCGVDEVCVNTPIHALCAEGETCSPTVGCMTSIPCTEDDECQDDVFCNGREFCMPEFGCMPAPMTRMCDDSDDCTIDSCDTDADMCSFTCDASRPACDCPTAETPCSGTFRISPAARQNCAFGEVTYNISSVTFACVGSVLSVDAQTAHWNPDMDKLTQAPRSDDGTFDIQLVIDGDCVETYRLQGRFITPDMFEATWTSGFGGGLCLDCTGVSVEVTGTRM